MRHFAIVLTSCILSLSSLFLSCKKDSEKKNLRNNVLSSENHISLTIESDTVTIIDGVDGWLNKVGSGEGVIDTNNIYLHREYSEFANNSGDTIRIYFIELFSSPPSQAEKEAIIAPGSYDLGYGSGSSFSLGQVQSGVAVTYVNNGVRWSTENNPQSDYLFIVDSQLVNSSNTSKFITFGRFEGQVFDINGNALNFCSSSFRVITYKN